MSWQHVYLGRPRVCARRPTYTKRERGGGRERERRTERGTKSEGRRERRGGGKREREREIVFKLISNIFVDY